MKGGGGPLKRTPSHFVALLYISPGGAYISKSNSEKGVESNVKVRRTRPDRVPTGENQGQRDRADGQSG